MGLANSLKSMVEDDTTLSTCPTRSFRRGVEGDSNIEFPIHQVRLGFKSQKPNDDFFDIRVGWIRIICQLTLTSLQLFLVLWIRRNWRLFTLLKESSP